MSEKIAEAMATLKQAMIDDGPGEPGSYAHAWHCNIAMAFYDVMMDFDDQDDFADKIANDAASRVMENFFGVETKK